jgi:hypothetical protein
MIPYLTRMLTPQNIHTWSLFYGPHKVQTLPSLAYLAEYFRTFQAKCSICRLSGWRDSQFNTSNTHHVSVTLRDLEATEAMFHFEIFLGTILVRCYAAAFNGFTDYGLFDIVGFAFEAAGAHSALHLYYDSKAPTEKIEADLRHVYFPAVIIGSSDILLDAADLSLKTVNFGTGPIANITGVELYRMYVSYLNILIIC